MRSSFHAVISLSDDLICGPCGTLESMLRTKMQGLSIYRFLRVRDVNRLRQAAKTLRNEGGASEKMKFILFDGASAALPVDFKLLRRDDIDGKLVEMFLCVNILDQTTNTAVALPTPLPAPTPASQHLPPLVPRLRRPSQQRAQPVVLLAEGT